MKQRQCLKKTFDGLLDGDLYVYPAKEDHNNIFLKPGNREYLENILFKSGNNFDYNLTFSEGDIQRKRKGIEDLENIIEELPSIIEVDISNAGIINSHHRVLSEYSKYLGRRIVKDALQFIVKGDSIEAEQSHVSFVNLLDRVTSKLGGDFLPIRYRLLSRYDQTFSPEQLRKPLIGLIEAKKYSTIRNLNILLPWGFMEKVFDDDQLQQLIASDSVLQRVCHGCQKFDSLEAQLSKLNKGDARQVGLALQELNKVDLSNVEERTKIIESLEKNRERLSTLPTESSYNREIERAAELYYNCLKASGLGEIESYMKAFKYWPIADKVYNGKRVDLEELTESQLSELIISTSNLYSLNRYSVSRALQKRLALEVPNFMIMSFDSSHRICERYHKPETGNNLNIISFMDEPNVPLELTIGNYSKFYKLTDENLKAIACTSETRVAAYAVQGRMQSLKLQGQLTPENISKLVGFIPSTQKIYRTYENGEIAEAEEYLGKKILLKDIPFIEFFKVNGLNTLLNQPPEKQIEWIERYWPEPSPFRDVILGKIWKPNWSSLNDPNLKLKMLEYFQNRDRVGELVYETIDSHLSSFDTFDERLAFALRISPTPSPERDTILERVLTLGSFTKQQYFDLSDQLSENFPDTSLAESSVKGTIGAIVTNATPTEKREIFLWLSGTNKEKPECIIKQERNGRVKLDRLKDLFAIKTYRHEIVRSLFAEANGLFMPQHSIELKLAISSMIEPCLRENEQDSETEKKLKRFSKDTISGIFEITSVEKRLKILQRLSDQIAKLNGDIKPADLVVGVLSSYGVVGVKLAQILSEQPVIQKEYPDLAEKLAHLKDGNPLTMLDAMAVVVGNPRLMKSEFSIHGMLGSASIKGALDATIDGEDDVIKILRPEASKGLVEEEEIFRELTSILTPVIENHFGTRELPNYSRRIFASIKEELDFDAERNNGAELRAALSTINQQQEVNFSSPLDRPEFCTKFCIVEKKASGVTLSEFAKNATSREKQIVFGALQQVVVESILSGKVVHNDLHGGNVYIEKVNGKFNIQFIDTGATITVTNKGQQQLLMELMGSSIGTLGIGKRFINHIINKHLVVPGVNFPEDKLDNARRRIENLPANKRAGALVALFAQAEMYGFSMPTELEKLLVGLSKASFVFALYPQNFKMYLTLGARLISDFGRTR